MPGKPVYSGDSLGFNSKPIRRKKREPNAAGKAFERLVDYWAARAGYVLPLPPLGGRFAGSKFMPQRMPYDRMVIHRGTGRAIALDCKTCADEKRFPVGNLDHVPMHQRQSLLAAGVSGCVIAGLLVEASHASLGLVYWIPWNIFRQCPASLEWGDDRMIEVGVAGESIDFDRLVESSMQLPGSQQKGVA